MRSATERPVTEERHGFSLIELLIAIAIILVIAAIAIPSLIRSRIAANQASAVESVRMIDTANGAYAATYNVGYTARLSYLGPPTVGPANSAAAGFIDSVLSGATNGSLKSGYSFSYSPGTPDSNGKVNNYTINASPITPGISGTSYYFSDESGVIRQNSTAPASSADSPVGG